MELLLSTWLLFQPQQNAPCPFEVKSSGVLQVQRMRYGNSQQCVILVSRTDRKTVWRSYSYFESGLFMIFLNFGSGRPSTDTGSKTYYFFPRIKAPTFEFSGQHLLISDASGSLHTFNIYTGEIVSISDTHVELSSEIEKSNEGGFQILSKIGLYLDNGFRIGDLPYVDPNATSQFKNSKLECALPNDELFQYTYKLNSDGTKYLDSVDFKLTDVVVDQLVTQKCNF